MPTSESVLVIGAGPTGMTAAMELARYGVSVRIVDRLPEASTTSRALAVQARTMELFEQRGLSDEMLRVGNQAKAATLYGRERVLGKQDFSRVHSRFHYILMISQAETERILREKLAQMGVTIERSVEMIAFSQPGTESQESHVVAVLRHPDGKLEEVVATYMISAEGAHSLARRTLGVPFEGETLTEKFMLGDLHIEGALPDDEMAMFLPEAGFLAAFPLGKRRFRMMASESLATPRTTEPTLEELQTAYNQNSYIPARLYDMAWSSHFAINSRMLHHLREGRIFFGGDSAHVHSPAGGQGMNTGIQDMIDLGWKMAMVLKKEASPALLDTYNAERIPVIRALLKTTETMTAGINPKNKLAHELITHVAPLALDLEAVQNRITGLLSQTRVGYRESPLSEDQGAQGSLHAGDRIPECEVTLADNSGLRLQQLISNQQLTLLIGPAVSESTTPLKHAMAPWQGLLTTARISVSSSGKEDSGLLDLFGHLDFLCLVRPDSYVAFCGRAESLPQLIGWLQRWFPRATIAPLGADASALPQPRLQ